MKSPSRFPDNVDAPTLDAAWKGIGVRRVRARRIRRAWKATPLLGVLAILLVFVVRQGHPSRSSQAVPILALAGGAALPSAWAPTSPQVVAFEDGSRLELAQGTGLRVPAGVLRDPSRVDLALETGIVTFDIRPGGPRAWVIDAGEAKVRVLGTRFTVSRDGEHVHVAVERGKVRVESARIGGGMRDLIAGQEVDLAGVVVAPSASPASRASASPAAIAIAIDKPVTSVEALVEAPPPSARPRPLRHVPPKVAEVAAMSSAAEVTAPPDRMAQADTARRAGHTAEAVQVLTAIVDDADPRAALAAFTIGKIDADERNDLAGAVTWFERAIRLGLPVSLDEDAHARLVECHGRAGRVSDAARAASRYEAKFPSGRHLARVQRWKVE